jgi:hypothetical protein
MRTRRCPSRRNASHQYACRGEERSLADHRSVQLPFVAQAPRWPLEQGVPAETIYARARNHLTLDALVFVQCA